MFHRASATEFVLQRPPGDARHDMGSKQSGRKFEHVHHLTDLAANNGILITCSKQRFHVGANEMAHPRSLSFCQRKTKIRASRQAPWVLLKTRL